MKKTMVIKERGIKKQTGLPALQLRTAFKSTNPVRDVHIPVRPEEPL